LVSEDWVSVVFDSVVDVPQAPPLDEVVSIPLVLLLLLLLEPQLS
jgi:hypothetical protein